MKPSVGLATLSSYSQRLEAVKAFGDGSHWTASLSHVVRAFFAGLPVAGLARQGVLET
ncbi:MAG: hypothetical protein WCI05_07040 [Myxococcales bacterium]|jgi:hypothetical protein